MTEFYEWFAGLHWFIEFCLVWLGVAMGFGLGWVVFQ